MDRKLTLSLDAAVIDGAKEYARSHGTSLSKLFERYLATLISMEKNDEHPEITPFVQSLRGIAKVGADYDHQADLAEILTEKYQ